MAIPGEVHEQLPIKIEHCAPEYLRIDLECIFPALSADLPALENEAGLEEISGPVHNITSPEYSILLEAIQTKLRAQVCAYFVE